MEKVELTVEERARVRAAVDEAASYVILKAVGVVGVTIATIGIVAGVVMLLCIGRAAFGAQTVIVGGNVGNNFDASLAKINPRGLVLRNGDLVIADASGNKYEDKPAVPTAISEQPAAIVRDLGDSVEFQRKTPFGVSKWVTKKTDLTDEEKGLIAADEAKRAVPAKDSDKRAESGKAAVDKSREKQEKQ